MPILIYIYLVEISCVDPHFLSCVINYSSEKIEIDWTWKKNKKDKQKVC